MKAWPFEAGQLSVASFVLIAGMQISTSSAMADATSIGSGHEGSGNAAQPGRKLLHSSIHETAGRQTRIGRLPGTNQLQLAITLPLREQVPLINLLQQIYDSRSTNFHRYLTPDQFTERFGPTKDDCELVKQFAKQHNLEVQHEAGNRAVLVVAGTAEHIERAFQTTLGIYWHPTEMRNFIAPDITPSVDQKLPILHIEGLDSYYVLHPSSLKKINSATGANDWNGSGAGNGYLGYDFRHAYAPGCPLTGSGQVVGLFENAGYTASDIQKYETLAGLPNVTLYNVLLGGPNDSIGDGTKEVALDIEMAIAMAPGLQEVVVYEGSSQDAIMAEMAKPTQGEPLPNQLSCSWGRGGGDPSFVQSLIEFAAQGQSFFYASGDGGAINYYGAGNTNMLYLTAVGGTELAMTNNAASWQSESTWQSSSGGILYQVPIPNYQKQVNMSVNQGSTIWRNYPDVAACADNIEVVWSPASTNMGFVDYTGGTSAAAPLWAGFAALINQQAASSGKPPIGFINPAIYAIGESPLYTNCFHDIIVGNNTNATSTNLFFACSGYDLCTGWGSPTGQQLIDALTSLSGPVFADFNYNGSIQNGGYTTPYRTLGAAVGAVSNRGTIFIEATGSSSERIEISKPVDIQANGSATIGH